MVKSRVGKQFSAQETNNAPLHQFIVKSLRGGRQTVFRSSSSKVILLSNNLIETDFLHISMVLRKIDNNVSVHDFSAEIMHLYTNLS